MPKSVFPYPGGKTQLAEWIIDYFPEHKCYVEVFGGGASVLVNKPESHTEVINDRDGDIVHFFRILRERGGELVDWLRQIPYAKDVHDEWSQSYYSGYRPDDDIERAGRFFYLRYSQYSAVYDRISGFSSGEHRNEARRFRNGGERLRELCDRFRDVQIENRDFEDIFHRFDGEETLFYCDPPYVEEGDALYTGGEFDHERFIKTLKQTKGDWIVSYMDIPESFPECTVVERETPQMMSKTHAKRKRDVATERLLMNFDPERTPSFSEADQSALTAYGEMDD